MLNHGLPFLSRDSGDVGLPGGSLRRAAESGVVRRVLRGVCIDAATPDSVETRAAAVRLVAPPDAVLAGVSAAWLHGVPPLVPNAHLGMTPLEVVRPAARAALRRPGVAGRTALIAADDICDVAGVLATTPQRTTLDLARRLDRPHALAYVDAMLRTGLVDKPALDGGLRRLAGRRWVEQAREMVDLGDPRAESPGESWMRLRWVDAGLPRPELQISLRIDGREVARLDAGLPDIRKGFEYDGEEFHGPEREDHDDRRRAWLQATFGWRVVGFRRDAVLGPTPAFEGLAAELTGLPVRVLPWEHRRRTYLHVQRWRARTAVRSA